MARPASEIQRGPRRPVHGKSAKPDLEDHRLLARWAADCAHRVLHHFEARAPKDDRPRKAIEAARAWARGEIRYKAARAAALDAHAAARSVLDAPAACAAARAAGHAVATAHVARHAAGAALYADKAVIAAASEAALEKERAWQSRRLPERMREIGFPLLPVNFLRPPKLVSTKRGPKRR